METFFESGDGKEFGSGDDARPPRPCIRTSNIGSPIVGTAYGLPDPESSGVLGSSAGVKYGGGRAEGRAPAGQFAGEAAVADRPRETGQRRACRDPSDRERLPRVNGTAAPRPSTTSGGVPGVSAGCQRKPRIQPAIAKPLFEPEISASKRRKPATARTPRIRRRAIIIRVSGVRVPPPALHESPANTGFLFARGLPRRARIWPRGQLIGGNSPAPGALRIAKAHEVLDGRLPDKGGKRNDG